MSSWGRGSRSSCSTTGSRSRSSRDHRRLTRSRHSRTGPRRSSRRAAHRAAAAVRTDPEDRFRHNPGKKHRAEHGRGESMAEERTERGDGGGVATAQETLSVTDNRTGETYELEISDGTVKAMDFRQIKVSEDDFGLMTYDPAFTNTASCRSSITYIDGEAGVLEHRGYPIEQLCEQSSYLEVAYLLVYGELPTKDQLDEWVFEITHHTFVHENIKKFVEGFRYDAHPMGMLLASVGALSTFYPEA